MYNCPLHWPLFRFAQNFDVMRNSMLLRKNAKNKIEFLGKKTLKNKTLSCKFFSFIYLYPEKKKKLFLFSIIYVTNTQGNITAQEQF